MNKLTAQQSAAILIIRQEARKLGIELPAEAATTPAAATITAPSPDEIAAAVTAALTAGKDPGKDPKVQALVTNAYLANLPSLTDGFEAQRDQETLAAFRAVVPGIHDALAILFTEAVATIERHKDAAPRLPLANMDPATMPHHAGTAALHIINANKRITAIAALWRRIHHMLPNITENPYSKALVIGHPTFKQWTDNRLHGANPEAWELVLMGVELNLANDAAEVTARFHSINEAQVKHEAAAREFEQFGHGGRAVHIDGNKRALDNLAANLANAAGH